MLFSVGYKRLYYKKTGYGSKCLILVHGGPGLTAETLNIIHKMLPEDEFTVVSYDQSGSPRNGHSGFHKSLRAYAEELHEVIYALKFQDVVLFGHSWGSAIVQEYLACIPSGIVKAVILANAFGSGQQLADYVRKRVQELPFEFHKRREAYYQKAEGSGIDVLIGEYWIPNYLCRLPEIPQDIIDGMKFFNDAPIFYYYLGADFTNINGAILWWDRTKELGDIRVPVLVMSGEYDYGSRVDFDAFVNRIPKATGWFESGVSHFPMYEKPEAFREAILQFLRNLS